MEIIQNHIIKIKIKQHKTEWSNLDRLLSQFKDQVKHDFISWYLNQHFNCYEHLLGSSVQVNGCCLGNLTKCTFSNNLLYCHMFSGSLPGACVWIKRSVFADLFNAKWTGICHHLWMSSVIQCHVMTLRRFRKFNCNLKDKIVFDSIKADKLLNLLGNYFKSSNQLSYEK